MWRVYKSVPRYQFIYFVKQTSITHNTCFALHYTMLFKQILTNQNIRIQLFTYRHHSQIHYSTVPSFNKSNFANPATYCEYFTNKSMVKCAKETNNPTFTQPGTSLLTLGSFRNACFSTTRNTAMSGELTQYFIFSQFKSKIQ